MSTPRRDVGAVIDIAIKAIMGRPDAHLAVIESLNEKDDGFDGVRVEVLDAPPVTRGPRAGRPNWRKATNRQQRLITWDDLTAAADAWETRTGLCRQCAGSGRRFAGWKSAEGTRYRICTPCNGTGSVDGVTISPDRKTEMFESQP